MAFTSIDERIARLDYAKQTPPLLRLSVTSNAYFNVSALEHFPEVRAAQFVKFEMDPDNKLLRLSFAEKGGRKLNGQHFSMPGAIVKDIIGWFPELNTRRRAMGIRPRNIWLGIEKQGEFYILTPVEIK